MKKPFRWLLSVIVSVLIMTWAMYDEISIARIQSAFRHITVGEILALIALILTIRLLIALIAYFPKAAEKQRALNQTQANTSSVSGDAELDFLNSLENEAYKEEAPMRPTSCSGCGAAISASDVRCAYCNTSIS